MTSQEPAPLRTAQVGPRAHPPEKRLSSTLVEHGVEVGRCHRSTQQNNCCHGCSIYLRVSDGLAVIPTACFRTLIDKKHPPYRPLSDTSGIRRDEGKEGAEQS